MARVEMNGRLRMQEGRLKYCHRTKSGVNMDLGVSEADNAQRGT